MKHRRLAPGEMTEALNAVIKALLRLGIIEHNEKLGDITIETTADGFSVRVERDAGS